ncbi:GNAT family N-acetyltransferase [Pseudomonas chlororaphis]|uniref:GNAT family N-acetyltransferase n=1 Tax=Pseudomonas chlororaphis TaxID=587753 RepID=UPI002367A704|nr:GNAT family N-acetyltransferase [Pseudomonas chlororaphis]WDG79979.1 GNAT family N-acetyltransferase [Pseudomonas chlororaphis]WDG86968.1 GNAT family N-acetyltransferase [Pseudomonas chlororaphis]
MSATEIQKYEVDSNLLTTHPRYNFPKDFDCGLPVINDYFSTQLRRALKSENIKGIGVVVGEDLMGFCTLTVSEIAREKAKPGLTKPTNLPAQVPVVRLVMLGVDQRLQKRGMGLALMTNALIQTALLHLQVPIKGLYLDAAPGAVDFYTEIGFKALGDPDENQSTPMLLGISVIMEAYKASLEEPN